MTPPVFAMPLISSSVRLRLTLQVACTPHGCDDRALGHRQHFGNRRMARMREIDDHPERLHPLHDLPADGGRGRLCDAVHRTRRHHCRRNALSPAMRKPAA